MSSEMDAAIAALNEKISGFSGLAKFVVPGEGSIMVDENGAREGDEEASVTLTADSETFQGILDGSMDPTAAFMTGKLSVDGDMGQAMALAGAMS